MNICVANSKDQTKKLKHKGSTGKKKENETESETITENEGERNGKKKNKKKNYIPLPRVQNTVKEEKDML